MGSHSEGGGLNVHELPGTHAEIVRPPLSEQRSGY